MILGCCRGWSWDAVGVGTGILWGMILGCCGEDPGMLSGMILEYCRGWYWDAVRMILGCCGDDAKMPGHIRGCSWEDAAADTGMLSGTMVGCCRRQCRDAVGDDPGML